jgi:hypothetical protein
MKNNPSKKPETSKLAAKMTLTPRQLFDKWFLPFLFVAIGSVMGWALWRG